MWSFCLSYDHFDRCFIILAWLGTYAGELAKMIAESSLFRSEMCLLSLWFLPLNRYFFVSGPFMAREIFFFQYIKYIIKLRHWLVSGRILWLPLIHRTNPGNYFVIVAVVFRHGLHNPSDYLLSLILMRCTIYIIKQLSWLDMDWCSILQRTQRHMNLLEPFIPFRRVLLQTLSCRDSILQNLLQSATTLRKV
jgi:hypothetical protein